MFLDIIPESQVNTPTIIITLAIFVVLAVGTLCAYILKKRNAK